MTSFTFNNAIPAAANNPSNDQPDILTNNISTQAILAVDHVTFNSTGTGGVGSSGGQHLQVTFNGKNTPAAQVEPISTAFTAQASTLAPTIGSASSVAQIFHRNQNGFFPVSAVKAFATFSTIGAAGAVTPTNAFNVSTVVASGAPLLTYTVTLTANAVTGNNIIVIPFYNGNPPNITYTFTNPTLTFTITTPTAAKIINFIVLQV